MTLKEYMEEKRFNITDMALLCRVSRTCIYRALRGENTSLRLAKRIYKKTNGEVKLHEDIS